MTSPPQQARPVVCAKGGRHGYEFVFFWGEAGVGIMWLFSLKGGPWQRTSLILDPDESCIILRDLA